MRSTRTGPIRPPAVYLLLFAFLHAAAAAASAPGFTYRPKVSPEGGSVRIAFAADRATDVEVAVVDAEGRVVRHLAAGMLGASAPAPLRGGSMRQELVWDRRDDRGRPVRGACRARVRLGLGGKLSRHLGVQPHAFRRIVGLAVSGKGELFVLDTEVSYGASQIRVFDRDGRYLRTIMPYSASLAAERVAPIGQLRLPDGRRMPIVYNAHGQNLHPHTSGMKHQTMAFGASGRLVLFSAVGSIVEHGPPRHLLFLLPDGGAPAKPGFIGPLIRKARGFMGGSGEGFVRFFDHVAPGRDGRWLYVSGGRFGSAKHMRHAVGRVRADQPGEPTAWIGEYDKPGADAKHLHDPQGLAVDSAGRLYVADRGNGRVVVHAPDGRRVGQFSADDPLQLFVHPRAGHIYVTSAAADERGRVKRFRLLKFSRFTPGGAPPKQMAELAGTDNPVIALDAHADPPRLWLAAWSRRGQTLSRVADRGGRLEVETTLGRSDGLAQPMFVAADAPRGKIYVTELRNLQKQIDVKTGQVRDFGPGGETAVDGDGFVYVIEGYPPRVYLHRYGPDGKPASFPGTQSPKMGPIDTASKGPHVGFRGHTIAPDRTIYILQMAFYGHGRVVAYRPDGTVKAKAIVQGIPNGSGGVQVDRRGNVYVSANLKPADRPLPAELAGVVPAEPWVWWRRPRPAPWNRPYYNAYLYHCGSVFRFPPTGGRFYPAYKEGGRDGREAMTVPPDATVYKTGYLNDEVGVAGATWRFHGYSPIPSAALRWGDPACTCMGARFSLDGFGRLFVPDALRFTVHVLDARGNAITRLGRYGNADDAGLALGWPAYVSCSGGMLFVSDMANRRVTVVELTAECQAVADIP